MADGFRGQMASSPTFISKSMQRAKKVVSNSLGLVDFAIRLVKSIFNLPDGQVMFFEELEWQKKCEINSARRKASGASWNDVWAGKC